MHEIAKAEGKISGRTSFDAAKQGDKAAQAVVKQYAQYVADGIVSVENVLQPDIISVGGGISREGEYLLQPVCEYAAANGFAFAGVTGLQLAEWYRSRRFCGRCGAAMVHSTEERMMQCPNVALWSIRRFHRLSSLV